MTAVIVTDALARHFKDRVTGTKEAYATGQGGQNAPVLPEDIYDTPIVLTMWRHVTVEPGSFERTTWTIAADAYFAGADPAAAYAEYVAYVDAVRSSIRGNWTLFRTCTQISRWEAGDPEDVTVNNKPFVRVPFEFQILEAGPQTYAAE
jgi:hypothetical protein